MIRALYTAASGMNAQQANIDTIAHNLANVNTAGFKRTRLEFEDLVSQPQKAPGTTTEAGETPIGLEVGLGTRATASARDFRGGNLRATGAPLDLAIEGRGFLQIAMADGRMGYTRGGALHLSAEGNIVTADGYLLNPPIRVPAEALSVTITRDGAVSATMPGSTTAQQLGTIELASFTNPAGLSAVGSTLFNATPASGEPTVAAPGAEGMGTVLQGFLEDSNVSVVEEMVNMILGQRAYEANSKVVKAADEMLSQVNNLAR